EVRRARGPVPDRSRCALTPSLDRGRTVGGAGGPGKPPPALLLPPAPGEAAGEPRRPPQPVDRNKDPRSGARAEPSPLRTIRHTGGPHPVGCGPPVTTCDSELGAHRDGRTLLACGPFWPWVISNSTVWPSSRLR